MKNGVIQNWGLVEFFDSDTAEQTQVEIQTRIWEWMVKIGQTNKLGWETSIICLIGSDQQERGIIKLVALFFANRSWNPIDQLGSCIYLGQAQYIISYIWMFPLYDKSLYGKPCRKRGIYKKNLPWKYETTLGCINWVIVYPESSRKSTLPSIYDP